MEVAEPVSHNVPTHLLSLQNSIAASHKIYGSQDHKNLNEFDEDKRYRYPIPDYVV